MNIQNSATKSNMNRLRQTLLTLLSLFIVLGTSAQVYDPVKWNYTTEPLGDNMFNLVFTAEIESHWHIYSQHLSPDEGPIPTAFDFKKISGAKLVGKTEEPTGKKVFDEQFQMDVVYFEDKVSFKQKVKLLEEKATIEGELTFMVCNEERCLPPDYLEFKFNLKGEKPKSDKKEKEQTSEQEIETSEPITTTKQTEIFNPVKWEHYLEKVSKNEYYAVFEANIDDHWHLYSINLPSDDGPIATAFTFKESTDFSTEGSMIEDGKLINEYDENFAMELSFFEHKVRFVQKLNVKDTKTSVEGELTFMVCDAERCLPPEYVDFKLDFAKARKATKIYGDETEVRGEPSASIGSNDAIEGRSVWGIFIISFLSGFAALLTPCVFPMIPMTVSFFTKQSKTKAEGIKNSIIYGISIILIYVVLGVVVTGLFGAEVLSNMATDPIFNLVFFLLLVIFAASFLGAFEITLPSSWINKADSRADKGGLIGIFFMALVLALVSFSCTGPIVGTLIVEAAASGGITPIIGMLGFSLAIALPFGLFAAFPGWMNSMPKSGGWLNSVKVVLGFLELALAMKFLSNADLVLQLHIIEREVFIAFWIILFGLLTMYLLGKLRLPHDSPLEYVGVGRLSLAIITGAFTLYMLPGMWGAPLKLISAFPPPLQYSESPMGVGFTGGGSGGGHTEGHGANPDQHAGPQGIMVFHDYEKGLAYAKEQEKPVMIDFTGHACVNCRKMEQSVWSDPEIKKMLAQDVVVISLYVDERTKLPESEQKEVTYPDGRTKKLRTVGNKWAYKQIVEYGANSQPLYIVQDYNGNDLTKTANYQDHKEVPVFKAWLKGGIDSFKKQ